MEKPAVIFSAEGFKMFTDLIRDLTNTKQPVGIFGGKEDADELVKAYFAREDRPSLTPVSVEPPKPNTMYDMDDVACVIATELRNNVGTDYDSNMISVVLNEHGYEYTPKGAVSVMRGTMKRYPNVVKLEAGLYAWSESNE